MRTRAPVKRRVVDKSFKFCETTVGDALEQYYGQKPSKGTFLRGVRDATGFKATRTADGLYMGCWESVGVQLHGFEIKVTRSDWLREIQDVSKAGQFTKYCHYWWVAAPAGVVELLEMPAHWGLKIVSKTDDGYAIKVAKAATMNQHAALDYGFFASCVRQCRRDDPVASEIDRKVNEAHRRGFNEGRESNLSHQTLDQLRKKVQGHMDRVLKFEHASGVRIDEWTDPVKIGDAVAHVMRHGVGNLQQLEAIVSHCRQIQEQTAALIDIQKRLEQK